MASSQIYVRPMTPIDNHAVADLLEEWRPREAYELRNQHDRYDLEAVAENAGEIVGWVSYKIAPCNPDVLEEYEDSTEQWLYIVEVFTSPAARRRGVGRELLRFAEEEGRSAGVRYSILMPEADERTESGLRQDLLEFYGSLGYEIMRPSQRYELHSTPWLMGLRL